MRSVLSLFRPAAPLDRSVWTLVLVVGTAFMASRYDFQLSTIALPQFQQSLGLSDQQATGLTAVAKLGAIPAVILTFMADRVGRKPLFLWSILGFSASALLTASAQSVAMLTIGLFLTRLFTMVDELLAVVLLAEGAPPAARGWLIGLLSVCGAFGDGLALIAYGNFGAEPDGWRWLYAAGALPALVTLYWRLKLPESAAYEAVRASGPPRTIAILRENWRVVGLLGLVYTLYWIPLGPALSLVSQHLQTGAGWTPAGVAGLTFVAGTIGLLGAVVGGAASDRFGRRKVAVAGCLLAGLGLSATYLLREPAMIGAAFSLGLLGWFASGVSIRALMTEAVPTAVRGTVTGVTEIFSSSGQVLGIGAVTLLIATAGGTGIAVVWVLPVIALAAGAVLFLPDTRGGAPEAMDPGRPDGGAA